MCVFIYTRSRYSRYVFTPHSPHSPHKSYPLTLRDLALEFPIVRLDKLHTLRRHAIYALSAREVFAFVNYQTALFHPR